MESPELFVAGIIVTLIVAGALALVVIGALLDGRGDQARDTGVPVYPTTEGDRRETRDAPEAEAEAARSFTEPGARIRHISSEA